jgi:hypothetical protein
MAEKRESSSPIFPYDAIEWVIVGIILLGLIGAAIKKAEQFKVAWTTFINGLPFYFINIFAKFLVFSVVLSSVLLILLIVYIRKENKIRSKIMFKILPKEGEVEGHLHDAIFENPKWKLVEEHINSDDPNKWKLAILESDIILSEMLDSLHLPGEGVGEKLKNVEESDFDHIEQAWEAHKIRNAIAHQGSDFILSQKEAKRVIKLYESVFEEFEII